MTPGEAARSQLSNRGYDSSSGLQLNIALVITSLLTILHALRSTEPASRHPGVVAPAVNSCLRPLPLWAPRPDVLQVEVSTVKKRVPLREQAQHTRLARDSTIHLEGWETTPEAQKRWVRDPSGCESTTQLQHTWLS